MPQFKTGKRSFEEKVGWFLEKRATAELCDDNRLDFIPDSLEQAYLIQDEIAKRLQWNVGGWKLGGTNQGTRRKFGCRTAYYGPIDRHKIISVQNTDRFEWIFPGPIRAEAELSFRLSGNVNFINKLKSIEDVLKYVDACAPSLEIPYCTISDLGKTGLQGLVADLCGSGYLVTGNPIAIDSFNLKCHHSIQMRQNDNLFLGSTSNIIASPVQALFEFFNLAKEHNLSLEPGQWVATGGCTSCVEFLSGSSISVEFSGMEEFQIVVNRASGKVLEIYD